MNYQLVTLSKESDGSKIQLKFPEGCSKVKDYFPPTSELTGLELLGRLGSISQHCSNYNPSINEETIVGIVGGNTDDIYKCLSSETVEELEAEPVPEE